MRLLPLLLAVLPFVCFAQYNQPPPQQGTLPAPAFGPIIIPPSWGHRRHHHHSHSRSRSHEKRRKPSRKDKKKKCSKCRKLSTFKGTWDTPSAVPQISYVKDNDCTQAVATCPADGKIYKLFGFPDAIGNGGVGFLMSRGTNLQRTLKCDEDQEWQMESLQFGQQVAVQSLLCTTGCPTGWLLFETSCYYFSAAKLGWQEAENDCVSKGSHLTSIHSQAEQDFLASLGTLGIWFGLRSSGGAKTYTDGTTIDYTHYYPNQNGNGCYGICNTPQCVDRNWYLVRACETQKTYVCKKPM